MRFVSHERVENVSGQAGRKDGVDLDEGLQLLRLLFVVQTHVAVRSRRSKGLVRGEEGGPVGGRRFNHPVDHREVRRASAGVGAGKRQTEADVPLQIVQARSPTLFRRDGHVERYCRARAGVKYWVGLRSMSGFLSRAERDERDGLKILTLHSHPQTLLFLVLETIGQDQKEYSLGRME